VNDLPRSAAIRAGTGLVVALAALLLMRLPALRRLEDKVFDRRVLAWRQLSEADTSRIVLVTIDEESLHELGLHWPLPRASYARAIERLRKAGAEGIGVTVVFQGAGGDPAQTRALAAVVDGADDVVLASRIDAGSGASGFRCATGFCDVPLDEDGIARHFQVSPAGVDPPPVCLALAMLRARYKNPTFTPRGFVDMGGARFPISWAGPPGRTFTTIGLKRVLGGGDLSKEVKGAVVLLGSTLPGSANDIRTPFSKGGGRGDPMTALELTANIVFTLMGSDALITLTTAQHVLLVCGTAFVLFVLFCSLHPAFSVSVVCFVSVLYTLGAMYAMIESRWLLPVVAPLVAVQVAWFSSIAYRGVRAWMRASQRSGVA